MDEYIVEKELTRFSNIVSEHHVPDKTVYQYLAKILGKNTASHLTWIKTRSESEIPDLTVLSSGLINSQLINNIRRVNKFLECANRGMANGQYMVIALETKNARKRRLLNKYPQIISRPYYCLDFILKRIFPKWKLTRKLYFFITNGRNRVISITEALGRLVSCGFEIIDYKHIDNKTYIISRKATDPAYDMQPTYGSLVKLRRVGKDGKIIYVYKMRTMHPYSEYLQEYVFDHHSLEASGKFKNDFRMTTWGEFFRKYWIDELPMFINFFRGEMKLVGVRPLSEHYFMLYPEDLQQMRKNVKPGLFPPYYADLPTGLDEIQESERNYLIASKKSPVLTDLKYFGKIFVNIVFRGARSG